MNLSKLLSAYKSFSPNPSVPAERVTFGTSGHRGSSLTRSFNRDHILAITQAVSGEGFYYAPDPSSQIACSIGGNIAENSGGVHSLKYGLTTNNVLGLGSTPVRCVAH